MLCCLERKCFSLPTSYVFIWLATHPLFLFDKKKTQRCVLNRLFSSYVLGSPQEYVLVEIVPKLPKAWVNRTIIFRTLFFQSNKSG